MAGASQAGAAGLATPSLSVTASPTTTVGLGVFATTNLNGGSNPTGTILFQLFGPSDTSCRSALFTSTRAVSGVAASSDAYTTIAAGTYHWQATFSGDADNASVGPSPCSASPVNVAPSGAGAVISAPAASGAGIHAGIRIYGYHPTGTVSVSLAGPGDTFCDASVFNATVAVNGSGDYVSADYSPTGPGTYRWQARYSGDANNMSTSISPCRDSNNAVTVSAPAGSPAAGLAPSSIAFGAQTVATTSAAQTVTVSNPGGAALNIASAAMTGANPAEFHLSADTCTGVSVAPGGSCKLAVSFTPSAAGARAASVILADNASGGSQTVALTGTGTATAKSAALIYPADGQTGVETTTPFSWSTVPNASYYYLLVGTTPQTYDVVNSGVLYPTQSSYTAPSLPASRTLFTMLCSYINNAWVCQSITFTTAAAANIQASLTYPTNGQTGVDTTKAFTWTTAPAATYYWLMIGTSPGDASILNSGLLPATQTSDQVPAMPAGRTLYAQIYSYINGAWISQTISFTTRAGS